MIPCTVMISAMLFAATLKVSSAFRKASIKLSSGYISRRRSLLITSKASTCFAISSTPSSAWSIFFAPSKRNGIVTIPTVRIPNSLLTRAITGAAPVPVPPPIPAVINAIFVPSSSICLISSMVSSAACRARSGRFPAPNPSFPNCKWTGTGESLRACASVLQRTKVTSWIPSLYIWLTALPPPPPTPITFIMLSATSPSPKSRTSNLLLSAITVCFYNVIPYVFWPILK